MTFLGRLHSEFGHLALSVYSVIPPLLGLIAIGNSRFLIDLYRYLTRCCEEVEKHLNSKGSGGAYDLQSDIFMG